MGWVGGGKELSCRTEVAEKVAVEEEEQRIWSGIGETTVGRQRKLVRGRKDVLLLYYSSTHCDHVLCGRIRRETNVSMTNVSNLQGKSLGRNLSVMPAVVKDGPLLGTATSCTF